MLRSTKCLCRRTASGLKCPAIRSRAWTSTSPTERQSAARISLGQFNLGAARDQRSTSCRVKFGWRRTGFLAGESLEHRLRQIVGIERDWRLETASSQDGPAFPRQLAHRNRGLAGNPRSGLSRSRNRRLLQHRIPVGKLLSAAIVTAKWFLRLAVAGIPRASNPYMEMIVMVPPRSHLGQPSAILARLFA